MTVWGRVLDKLASEIVAGLKTEAGDRRLSVKDTYQTITIERGTLFKIEGGNVTINHYAAPPPEAHNSNGCGETHPPFAIVPDQTKT